MTRQTISQILIFCISSIFVLALLTICIWQVAPTVILGLYNQLTVDADKGDGKAIIDELSPNYIEPTGIAPICFKRLTLDTEYHTEGASVADIDQDGLKDILTGNFWYQAPNWDKHLIREQKHTAIQILRPSDFFKSWSTGTNLKLFPAGYSESFFAFPHDVNQDSWIDLIVLDITTTDAHWYKNPGRSNHPWKAHKILNFTRNESPFFADILSIGSPQLITGIADQASANGNLVALKLNKRGEATLIEISAPQPQENNGALHYSHGLGAGDINSDGLTDIIFGTGIALAESSNPAAGYKQYNGGGWYEQVISNGTLNWVRHSIDELLATSQLHVMDISGDGKADIIGGSAHNSGLFWFEQKENNQWHRHLIDGSYTQLHASAMADLDGDGADDIITGKTWLAHLGLFDPDEFDPPVLYWYRQIRMETGEVRFIRYLIDDSVGIGRQITVEDVDDDGRKDVVIGNRNGVHIYLQKLSNKSTACENKLSSEKP